MNKLLMLLLAALVSCITYSYAQINAYTFNASAGTYTDITGGTYVRILASDAGTSAPIPLGFDFVFNGVTYTQVVATSTGFLSFNLSAVSTATNNLATSAATLRPLLAPLWDNLRGATNNINTTRFSYITTGTAGSRIFTAEWKGWLWGNGNLTNTISFQVKLYEGTNKIDFVYRPESSSIANPSASIGIAGSGVGPGNFLSLNSTGTAPVASATVETTTLSTKPVAGQTYSFVPPPTPNTDINISSINTSAGTCPNASFPVSAILKNAGNNPIDFASTNAIVSIAITGPVTQNLATTISNGTLAPGATQVVTLLPAVNLSANGTYNFRSLVTVAGDENTSNDTTNTRLVLASATAPWTETFAAASLPAGWKDEGWYAGTFSSLGIAGNPGNCLYKNIQTDTAVGSFTSLFVGPVAAPMQLSFDYRVTSALTPYNAPLPTWGSFIVQVSSNCGNTFTTIDTVKAVSSDWLSKSYPLAAYAGQYVTVRIVPKWNAGNHYLAFDNFSVKEPSAIDVATTSITTNLGACPYTNAQFSVVVKNNAALPINFATNNATVTVNITGRATQTLSALVDTGTLALGAVRSVIISPANLSLSGFYNLRSYITVAGDGAGYNDTTTSSTTVVAPTINTVPWAEGFSYYGSTTPPGWTTTGWSRALTSVIEPTQGYYLYRFLNANNSSNIITSATIGPITANNRLSFDFKLADNNNFSYVPSYAWGNFKVQISTGCSGVFTTIDSVTDAGTSNGWSTKSYSLAAYVGQSITVQLVATWASGSFAICFDNFQVYTPPAIDLATESINYNVTACAQSNVPGSITIKNRGTGTINFATNNAQLNVTLQRATSGGQYAAAYITTGTLAPDSSMTVALFPNANFIDGIYEIRSDIVLAGDGNENNNKNIAKKTIGIQSVFPWSETFTTNSTPQGWSTGGWQIGAQRGATGNPGFCVYKNFNASAMSAAFTTVPSIPLPSGGFLSFNYKLSNYASPYNPPAAGWGGYKVQISTDCGISFTTIDSVTAVGTGWTPKMYSLSAYAGQPVTTRIQAAWAAGDYDLAFDNFKIDSQTNCNRPIIINADSVTTTTTTTVYFSGTGGNFIAEYGPVGFTPGTDTTAGTGGTIVNATVSPVTITGLAPGTSYQLYIRQNCAAITLGYSSNSRPDTFSTKPVLQNDLPNGAVRLIVGAGCTGAVYSNADGTQAANEPAVTCSGLQTGGKTVWFKFRAPASGFVKISTDGAVNTLTDTRMALYAATDSSDLSTFQIIACDDDNGVLNSAASIIYANELIPFQNYYIAVDAYNGIDTGRFCLQVAEVTSTMIAATGSCTAGQPVTGLKADYKGWVSLTNTSGQLIANVRSNANLFSAVDYRPYLYINTSAVRQSATGEYYLDRNIRIADTARGNYDVQLYMLNTELAALQAADTAARLSNLHVTKVKGETVCNPNFVSGGVGNDTLLLQNSAGMVNGISWVTVNTNGFSNFYLHPGSSQLSRVYAFIGNGAWSNPANWSNNEIPPAMLPPHSAIEINPAAGGQCIMDIVQRVTSTSVFRVKTGTNMVVTGSLIIQ